MSPWRVGTDVPMPMPLVSRFVGLQALICGAVGVLLSALLDHLGLDRISTAAGIFTSVTLLLIVLGRSLWGLHRLWIVIGVLSLFNVGGGLVFYEHAELKPIAAAPFLLIEIAAYLLVLGRMRNPKQP